MKVHAEIRAAIFTFFRKIHRQIHGGIRAEFTEEFTEEFAKKIHVGLGAGGARRSRGLRGTPLACAAQRARRLPSGA